MTLPAMYACMCLGTYACIQVALLTTIAHDFCMLPYLLLLWWLTGGWGQVCGHKQTNGKGGCHHESVCPPQRAPLGVCRGAILHPC